MLSLRPSSFILWFGGDEGSRTLIDRFTRPTLCYPVELHRHKRVRSRESGVTGAVIAL